jgi:ABC-type multidrug transport system ATPase subunit
MSDWGAGCFGPGPGEAVQGRQAVRGVDLEVHRGEMFAFLGSNGAGKTTTVEILEGFRDHTAGDVTGRAVGGVRREATTT